MYRVSLLIVLTALLTLFASCGKDKHDLVTGTWERVNVENIDDPYTYEWEFEDGSLTMYRRLKSNTSTLSVTDNGFYLLDTSPVKTTLKLIDTSNEIWNDRWDVIKLTDEQLIMRLEIEGGVLYFEFVKIL